MVSQQIGSELVVCVVVVFVLIFLTEKMLLEVAAAAHFSMYYSDAAFICTAFLSCSETR